ncbi:MAG: lytic transglycosylase domain-containing protein [Methylocystaceae bacterium]|nr:lytic transglycosylase domain-containing protein [Methylocystaceae bacterium]
MQVNSINDVQDQIIATINKTAQRTGGDFSFLLNQAKIESGLNPDAQAKTSSAVGLYQFTRGTWLGLIRSYGDQHGLTSQAQSLRQNSLSPQDMNSLLALRKDPELATSMAAHFAADNAKSLSASGLEKIGPTELYLAHFLGAGGAKTFLEGLKANAQGPAAMSLPDAAESNKTIFFSNGQPRSYQQIYDQFAAKFVTSPSVDQPLANPMLSDKLNGKLNDLLAKKENAITDDLTSVLPTAGQIETIVANVVADTNRASPSEPLPVSEEAMNKFLHGFLMAPDNTKVTPTEQADGRDAFQGVMTEPSADGFNFKVLMFNHSRPALQDVTKIVDSGAQKSSDPQPAQTPAMRSSQWVSLWTSAPTRSR